MSTEKILVSTEELVSALNAGVQVWRGRNIRHHQCEVASVHRLALPDRNWGVGNENTAGVLMCAGCLQSVKRVQEQMVTMFDVNWE